MLINREENDIIKWEGGMYMHAIDGKMKQEVSEDIFSDITHFLSKKRLDILLALYENGELSQGELARIVKSTVTSAANILMKFAQCEYRLIEVNSRGKYRYYNLTSLAVQYVEYIKSQQKKEAEEQIIHHSELMLLQKAKNSISEFKRIYEDDWDIVMDDCLINYIECKKMKENEEQLIQGMLHSLALMDLDEYENSMDKFLEMIDVPILSKRIEQYMEKFATIRPILALLRDDKNVYQVNEFLVAIIQENILSAFEYAESLGIQKQYEEFKNTINWLKDNLYGKEKQEIFLYIKRFFPGQQQLCFALSDRIYSI